MTHEQMMALLETVNVLQKSSATTSSSPSPSSPPTSMAPTMINNGGGDASSLVGNYENLLRQFQTRNNALETLLFMKSAATTGLDSIHHINQLTNSTPAMAAVSSLPGLGHDLPFSHHHHRRRQRTNFSNWQLLELERAFTNCHYPDQAAREALANALGLAESRIQVSIFLFLLTLNIIGCHILFCFHFYILLLVLFRQVDANNNIEKALEKNGAARKISTFFFICH